MRPFQTVSYPAVDFDSVPNGYPLWLRRRGGGEIMPGSTLACLIRSQGSVQRMRGKQGAALSQHVCTVAAVHRVVYHGGTYGVELDIALAQQSIGVFLHQ
jgi:hypothetical protein